MSDPLINDRFAGTLRIARELKSPNKFQGHHWRVKHRETQDWEFMIRVAVLGIDRRFSFGPRLVPFRRRVTVTRIVPSRQHFIRDDDNLRFSTKAVNDSLKRLGLVYDDSRAWMEQPMPTQVVGTDFETVIRIEPTTDR